jgi:hypothetical protein
VSARNVTVLGKRLNQLREPIEMASLRNGNLAIVTTLSAFDSQLINHS